MPTRSSGCLTCRKRKIRCDETRPGCRRCETHGVACPGYRTDKPGGIEFKDQTTATKQKADEQYRIKQALRAAADQATGNSEVKTAGSSVFIFNGLTPASLGSGQQVQGKSSRYFDDSSSPIYSSSSSSTLDLDDVAKEQQAVVLANTKGGISHSDTISVGGPQTLFSPELERLNLYGSFISSYLPQTQRGAQNGHFSFFQTVAEKRSSQPALQQSLDSLSLVQMGSLQKDQTLLKQAVRQYGRALNSLARAIAKGQFLHDDEVLAAVTVLATCELYDEISKTGEGWGKHVQGANQLVAARGPDSIQSDLALLLYSNMRHGSLLHALIERKAPFMATPEWRAVAFRVPLQVQDSSTTFYDIAIQIPGLLEKHDALNLDDPTALESVDALLADSAELERRMREWFDAWQTAGPMCSPPCTPYYELHPIEGFPTFCSLCPDRTFGQAFVFPDFLVAYLHSLYWMNMHYLRTNTQSLQKHRHRLVDEWYPSTSTIVEESELLTYILNLCCCIPYFVEPVSSSAGSIGIFLPMRCAAIYFTAHGHWEYLKWIGSIKNSVFVRGLVPPTVKREGNVGRVSPGP